VYSRRLHKRWRREKKKEEEQLNCCSRKGAASAAVRIQVDKGRKEGRIERVGYIYDEMTSVLLLLVVVVE